MSVEVWSARETAVALDVELWIDEKLAVVVPLASDTSEYMNGTLTHERKPILSVSYGVEHLSDHSLARRTVLIEPLLDAAPAGYRVAIAAQGSGRVDGWISQSDYRFGTARFAAEKASSWVSGDGGYSVTVPATARSIIAVGAYTVRSAWIGHDNEVRRIEPELPYGVLSPFSSTGPSFAPEHTGLKPDLCAPGSLISSARAISVPTNGNVIDAAHVLMQGTSMAAPHVTGAVALMLEANPKLDPAQARAYLQQSSRADGHTGLVPNVSWGYGKLNAHGAVALAETEASGCAAVHGGCAWLVLLVCGWRLRLRRTTRH